MIFMIFMTFLMLPHAFLMTYLMSSFLLPPDLPDTFLPPDHLMSSFLMTNLMSQRLGQQVEALIYLVNRKMAESGKARLFSQPSEPDSPAETPNSEQSKSSLLSGRPLHQAEFEKNYPKNIFIPLIEYLGEMGYRQAYEKCVGGRSEVEGKNVVSLGSIYILISQGWFVRNISSQLALSHISNKILLNSKIKKKLFHLLIAQLILTTPTPFLDLKDFKRKVSREANLIAKRPQAPDSIFNYPNAIIYLLHFFLTVLRFHASKKGHNKLEEQMAKLSLDQTPPLDSKAKNIGSKEQYKFYVKEIVHLFAGKSIGVQNYPEILEEVKQTILQRDRLFRQRYRLVEGIPNWLPFIECVVIRCFQYKRKDIKLTNFLFNEWINECKLRMLSIADAKSTAGKLGESEKEADSMEWVNNKLHFHEKWGALPLIPAPQESVQKAGKSFAPIIVSTGFSLP